MKNIKIMTYNNQFDILYVTFKSNSNSYGDEDISHLVIFKDFDTDEVTGLTIFDFKKMYENKDNVMRIVSEYFDIKDAYNKYCS